MGESGIEPIVFNQNQEIFFQCHINAFEHFGGVPQKVVPDNLKAAVIQASFENPVINRVYRLLAEHYNFMISTTLPRKPEHKGGVENDVKYIKKNFWPIFKEGQKDKGYAEPNSEELNRALADWNKNTARIRKIGGVGRSTQEIFENEEKHELQPLPSSRWAPVEWGASILVQDIDGLRPARAIVFSLKKKYGISRVEAAFKRAWSYDTPEYSSVKSILIKELDKIEIEHPVDSQGQQLFLFARELGYFDPAGQADAEGGDL